MSACVIRTATCADAPALAAIYAPYVERTAITFEYAVPSPEAFARRMARTLEQYPYLVAERDGRIRGYAYAGSFNNGRDAYRWCCETTVYVAWDDRRSGVGRALYQSLEEQLARMGILNLYACVAYPPVDDPFLTLDSVRFHERLGFGIVGRFHECGYKFDHWYDMVWMEKYLARHDVPQRPITPFPALA